MTYFPPRAKGFALGLALSALFLSSVVGGVLLIASSGVTPWLALWVALPILGLPLSFVVLFRLYGLVTARYGLDRNGLYLRWGAAIEQIPLEQVRGLEPDSEWEERLQPGRGLTWPGCVVGDGEHAELGRVEFFATTPPGQRLLVILPDRALVISPSDLQAFQSGFADAVRLGALERIPSLSQRSSFFSAQLWADRAARALILAGVSLPLALLGFLAFQASRLPGRVPFGFDAMGQPDLLVPAPRLLLLPLAGGFWWLVDLLLGAWMYRSGRNRPLAYLLWGASVGVGALLWGAGIHLVRLA